MKRLHLSELPELVKHVTFVHNRGQFYYSCKDIKYLFRKRRTKYLYLPCIFWSDFSDLPNEVHIRKD